MRGELLEVIAEPLRTAKQIIASLPGVLEVQVFGDRMHVWVEDAAKAQPLLTAALSEKGIGVEGLRRTVPGLEDVFISLVAGGKR